MDYEQLKAASLRLGNTFLRIQGARGCTSFKEDGWLTIKAPEKWLARAFDEATFVTLSQKKLDPASEAALHAAIPAAYVFHTHSLPLLAYTVQKNGQQQLKEKLEELEWSWIPYVQGEALVNAVRSVSTRTIVLQNGGLIVSGEDPWELLELMDEIEARLHPLHRKHAWTSFTPPANSRLPHDERTHFLALDRSARESLKLMLYPEQAPLIDSSQFTIMPEGVALAKTISPEIELALLAHALLMQRIPENAQLSLLTSSKPRQHPYEWVRETLLTRKQL